MAGKILHEADPSTARDRAVGCFIGLAVGDALGAPVEFKSPGTFEPVVGYRAGGPFNLNAGEWTDDTSMAIGLGLALVADPFLLIDEVQRHWIDWARRGAHSHNGRCFDIGNQTSIAVGHLERREPLPATDSAGNGSIMRLAPVITRWWADPATCRHIAIRQSNITHNNQACASLAGDLAMLGAKLVAGTTDAGDLHSEHKPDASTGYVRHTAGLARWSLAEGGTFLDMVLRVVNMGGDSDTAGAVTGMLAGARHGLSGIPKQLVEGLTWKDRLLKIANLLFDDSVTPRTLDEADAILRDVEGEEAMEEGFAYWRRGTEEYKALVRE